ncbi:PREDICTED: glucan endo-1,3-beta-glucosidase-like isoform X2 [Nelumbo nucifera]|uniref:Glucan endo-1,3-beta-glucosidase-like isoform X2 n=1 Tax=Nelumbo nucifera TaxID=4432 RepID=A0A1U8AYG4_NELNU|nr:PREDICTED: glucan endo-1,3-beta-glucosidase-like isoform X2 [Nelumbo nucifera]XP_010273334.1 PREDICTED: glucan endo-1,3-beta-glucosidase-like isoform X2 [Nelumbo nucifera]
MDKFYAERSNGPSVATATMLFFVLLMAISNITGAQRIGVCYGMLGNNLPSKSEVVALYEANNIQRMRVYAPNQEAFQALKGSNIEVMLGVPNQDLQRIAGSDLTPAYDFVYGNVVANKDTINFNYILVGNEVDLKYFQYVLPAMKNIQSAVETAGLQDRVKVTTATHSGVLDKTYPPSNSVFRSEYLQFMRPIIGFLAEKGSPLCANIYPYFAYIGNPSSIRLDYALFTAPEAVVSDDQLNYHNLFDALLDSFYAAVEKEGGGSVKIVVSETGWPNAGESAATTANAQTYLNGLIQHVKGGTPRRPNGPIEAYIFAMFDENEKPPLKTETEAMTTERHYGLFNPNQNPKYQISFS